MFHWLKPDIVETLSLATAVGPNTHGHFIGINDSVTYDWAPAGLVAWTEIQTALSARPHAEIPTASNLAFLYACNTLSFLDPAVALGTANSPSRATTGFTSVVWTHGKRIDPGVPQGYGTPFTLDQHVINSGSGLFRGML